jgi:ABC-2 type transport system ATP-binding protein
VDILTIENLSKSFGNNKVIDGLSFAVPEHSVFGFIGQNGAGKTTTMKMILGLLKADSGKMVVCGEAVSFGQTKTNEYIGYLPDVPEFYPYMRPKEYLKLCGDITGMSNDRIKSRSEELLALVGLSGVNKKIGSFSRGMKQRLGIAQALLNEPKLLICDEPTSALDPIGRKEILDILLAVKGKATVVFSTHILADVERICDNVAVLNNGRLALCGTLSELKAQHKADSLLIEFATSADKERFIALSDMTNYEQTETSITIHTGNIAETQMAVLELIAKEKLLPQKLEVAEPTIESLFLEVVQ